MSNLERQVCVILHAKIKRISVAAHTKANDGRRRHIPYSLPVEVDIMVAMLGRTATATADELEAMVQYATTGAVRELVCS